MRSRLVAVLVPALGLLAACGCAPTRSPLLALAVSDTIGREWKDEPIYWDVSFSPGEWRGTSVLVSREGALVPAQITPTERHRDGSVKSARIVLLIDKLAKDATTHLVAELDKKGPADTDLSLTEAKEAGHLVLANRHTAVKVIHRNVIDAKDGEFSPLLGVRTASGKWTGGGYYEVKACKPVSSATEILETGPVRLAARVTTTFDNGRTHVVTVSLLAGARSIDIDERFNLGPDNLYRFKEYKTARDGFAWEPWTWYGDADGTKEDHPNNWFFALSSPDFQPREVRYRGESSTDKDKGRVGDRGESLYTLSYEKPRRLEKYLAGHGQWRPDAVTWYAASPSADPKADVVALFTHSVRHWRNPDVRNVPGQDQAYLHTGANDLRILSFGPPKRLVVQCPIGLGRRVWAIRASTVEETFRPTGTSTTALSAEAVQRDLGLDITRRWITQWPMTARYPHLFIHPSEKDAYFARLKGKEVGAGGGLRQFLLNQDPAGAEALYRDTLRQADAMIDGYWSTGTDNTNTYPGWMLGYWHGIIVACGLDNLLGSPHCTLDMASTVRRKMAILTYCLTSRDAWPDKQINYGWGSMNMPVGRWGGLVTMASSINDHPLARAWLKDAGRYYRMLLETEYSPDGVAVSCPHYIGASSTSFYAWIVLANSGLGQDVSAAPVLGKFARYYMQMMTPVDRRWGLRTLLTEGDSRPGSSPLPGILATLFRKRDADLAGQLLQIWKEGGQDMTSGMGVPDGLLIDPTIPPAKPKLGPQVFPGFGAVLRYRELGTPEEAYLTLLAGNFMFDHTNEDHLAFEWYEKGVPLTLYTGDMYVPGAMTALSHNTLCWDVRPEGDPTPGKDRPGDWYFDHKVPWVEHVKRPRLHLQIAGNRGLVTYAADQPEAALIEGQVGVPALTEVPTRADYSTAMLPHAQTPEVPIKTPFIWTRRLLYVKAPTAAGMNYLVVCDDLDAFAEHTPSFNYWSLADEVELAERSAHFKGQLGVDTDLFVVTPAKVRMYKDSFTHNQCEPVVGLRHRARYGKEFSEKQVLARIEGEPGRGFLVAIFPRAAAEPAPELKPWLDGRGLEVTWQGWTHYVLLSATPQDIDANGVRAKASCLVLKVKDPLNFVISMPAGGEAIYGGETLKSPEPIEVRVEGGKATRTRGTDLLGPARGR